MDIKNILKKRNIPILAGVLIFFAVITAILVLTLGVNGKKPDAKLTSAVDAAWDNAKTENQPEFLTKIDELSSFKLTKVQKEDGRYIIKATVTAPDLSEKLSKLEQSELPQNNNPEELNKFLCKQLEDTKIKNTDSIIYAFIENGEYHITFSEEFVDAMSGNLYSFSKKAYMEILQNYNEGELK